MRSQANDGGRRNTHAIILTALIFLVTINLRPAITTVGPVLTDIGATFGLRESLLGLLGALPLLMFALVSPFASGLSSRFGAERALWFALLAIAIGVATRSLLGAPGLWIGTVVAMAAIAVGNVLVPVVVRQDYPGRVSLATGIYSATMGFGAASASALSAPVAERLGWQQSLLLWAIPAVVVAVLWAPRAKQSVATGPTTSGASGRPVWKSAAAWWHTVFMGLQSAAFYFMVTWLPAFVAEQGDTPESAGVTLFWYQIAGITAGFIAPVLLRRPQQVLAALTGTVPIVLGFTGLLVFPSQHLVCAIVLGIGSGISLVVSLSLISMRGRDGRHTAQLSGMVQSGGYLIAAFAPLAAGMLAQFTGKLSNAFMMMAVCALVQCVVAVVMGRGERPRA